MPGLHPAPRNSLHHIPTCTHQILLLVQINTRSHTHMHTHSLTRSLTHTHTHTRTHTHPLTPSWPSSAADLTPYCTQCRNHAQIKISHRQPSFYYRMAHPKYSLKSWFTFNHSMPPIFPAFAVQYYIIMSFFHYSLHYTNQAPRN